MASVFIDRRRCRPQIQKKQIEMPAPNFQFHVFCCTNQRPPDAKRGCCAGKNAEKLRDYMKSRAKELGIEKTRINAAGCLDQCESGPIMVIYPEGVWYRYDNESDIDEILSQHLKSGVIVERLLLPR